MLLGLCRLMVKKRKVFKDGAVRGFDRDAKYGQLFGA